MIPIVWKFVLASTFCPASASMPPEMFVKPGDVHFKKAGSEQLAAEVVRSIRSALPAADASPSVEP
jgi:hypothetical protein